MTWQRLATYALAVAAAALAAILPDAALVLVPIATGLAGLATTFPGTEVARKP